MQSHGSQIESHASEEVNFPNDYADIRSRDGIVPVRISCWFEWCSSDLTSERGRRCQIFKIITASFLPGLLLLAQNAISLNRSQQVIAEKESMYANTLYSFEIAKLIHFTQIERGTSAMFVGSGKDSSLILRLQDAYDHTNDAIWGLSRWIPVTSQPKFASREVYEQWIQNFRYDVFTLDKTIEEVLAFYTNANADFIHWIINTLKNSRGLDSWSAFIPYHFLIISKESAGVERAIGSYLYASDPSGDHFLLWYQEALVLGKTYLENSVFYSSFMEALLQEHYLKSLLEKSLESMRQDILSNETLDHSVRASKMWFDNMTLYINMLLDFHDKLGAKIIQQTEAEISNKRTSQNVDIVMTALMACLLAFIFIQVHLYFKQLQTFVVDLDQKTIEFEHERRKNEHILFQMLPTGVAKKLIKTDHVVPELYQSATVLFSDVYELDKITRKLDPVEFIKVMNGIYQTIDERIDAHDVYKVEAIGDVYMVASGIPERNGNRHITCIAELSLDLIKTMGDFRVPQLRGESLLIRIGFCTGQVATGIVGNRMPRYCLFGDTVNVASRMKSTSLPMKIQVTEDTYKILAARGDYLFTRRGYVPVKGKGDMLTYWFHGRKDDPLLQHEASTSGLGYTAITNIEIAEDEF